MRRVRFLTLCLGLLLALIMLTACGKKEPPLSYYKQVWNDSFLHYQQTKTQLKSVGTFNLDISVIVAGDQKKVSKLIAFDPMNAHELKSLSISADGEYDFSDATDPKMEANLKFFLNKTNIGPGELDMRLRSLGGGRIEYTVNHFSADILEILGAKEEEIKILEKAYEESEGKSAVYEIDQGLWFAFISAIKDEADKEVLTKNTADEEKRIIDAFLKDEVIEVQSGSSLESSGSIIDFTFNKDHFITFLGQVSEIIGGKEGKKDFSQDKETLKNFNLGGKLTIKDNLIADSRIIMQLALEKSDGKADVLNIENKLKLLSPDKIDLDLTSKIYSSSQPQNILNLSIKGWIR